MNYSKRTTKNSMGKRILQSWAIIGLCAFLLGVGITLAALKAGQKPVTVGQYIADAPTYGAFEGIVFPAEKEWEVDRYSFIPLPDLSMDADLQEFTYYLSAAYEVDYSLILALIDVESGFNPTAISSTGDYGLMQINQCNAGYLQERVGAADLLNPYDNIKGGVYILRGLFEKYGDSARVLMAYNMGERGAARLWGQGIFESNYSKSVLQRQADFNERLNNISDGGKAND